MLRLNGLTERMDMTNDVYLCSASTLTTSTLRC